VYKGLTTYDECLGKSQIFFGAFKEYD